MSKYDKSDIISLKDFELSWRWLDERWNILPQSSLDSIHPLNSNKACELRKESLLYFPALKNGQVFYCEGDEQLTRKWLNSLGLNNSMQIIVSWSENVCIVTTVATFIQHWDDFCYPSSDQIIIWTDEDDWVLFYEEFDAFVFSNKTAHLTSGSS